MIRKIRTTCKSCHGGCGVIVSFDEDKKKIIGIEGDPLSLTRGTMCAKGLASILEQQNPGRLKYPLIREKNGWKKASWNEALDVICGRLKKIIKESGAVSIAIGSGTARGYHRYVFRLGRSIGTPNLFAVAHFCFGPRLAAYGVTFGERLYCDWHGWGGKYPRVHILWGKQIEYTNADGEMGVWFLDSLEKGEGKLIIVDPRLRALTKRADLWLQIRPGTDAALALGMIHVVIKEELYDKEFVENWCFGFEKLKERVEEFTPRKVARITWLKEEDIVRAARIFARERPGVIQVGNALEAQNNSVQTIRAISCLIAICGNVERPGGMMMWVPPEGGCMEEFATEIPFSDEVREKAVGADRFKLLTGAAGTSPFVMCHVDSIFHQLIEGDFSIRAMLLFGTNPLLCYANSKEVYNALKKLEFLVVADLYMTPAAELAHVVLPAAHWLEIDDIYDLHPRFFISAVQKVVDPPGEAWADNKIINQIGKRLAPGYWFEDVYSMLDYQLSKTGITWKEFKEIGYIANTSQPYFKYKTDYWKKGGGFKTPTGKVELYSTILEKLGYDPLPFYREPNESPYSTPSLYKEYPLILTTGGRLPYYFHSQYRLNPLLREIQPFPYVQIHPDTAKELDIQEGDWVWIESPRGKIKQKARLFRGLHPRVVVAQASWYYPEKTSLPQQGIWESNVNVLTSNDPPYDPAIGSTTFRALLCRIYKVKDE